MPPGVAAKVVHVVLVATALLGAPAFVILTRSIFGVSPSLLERYVAAAANEVGARLIGFTGLARRRMALMRAASSGGLNGFGR